MSPDIWIRGEGGSIFGLDLPLHESIEDKLRKGTVTRVANAAGDPYTGDGADAPAPPAERPAKSANKDAWIGWAVVQGATPDEAAALTKTDLVEKYGQAAAPEATTVSPAADAGAETDAGAAGGATGDDGKSVSEQFSAQQ